MFGGPECAGFQIERQALCVPMAITPDRGVREGIIPGHLAVSRDPQGFPAEARQVLRVGEWFEASGSQVEQSFAIDGNPTAVMRRIPGDVIYQYDFPTQPIALR